MRNLIRTITLESAYAVLEYSAEATIKNYGQEKLYTAMQDDVSEESKNILATIARSIPNEENETDKDVEERIAEIKRQSVLELFKYFEVADPTKKKAYVQFIAKNYALRGWGAQIEDILSKIKPALEKYDKLKQKNKIKAPYNDILKFTGFEEFVNKVEEFDMAAAEEDDADAAKRGKSVVFFENDKVKIINPKDKAAAIYYGQGTRWCTAATSSSNYFEGYFSDGDLYIFLPKQPAYPGEKYQAFFDPKNNRRVTVMNELDRDVDSIDELILKRFGNLGSLFLLKAPGFNNVPGARDSIAYASDEDIQNNMDIIRHITMDFARKTFEGKSPAWFNKLNSLLNIPAETLRAISVRSAIDGGTVTMRHLDYILGNSVLAMGDQDDGKVLRKFITRHIAMKRTVTGLVPVLVD